MRKRIIRRLRKNLMRLGTITREEILNKEDDGSIVLDKKEWGYCVECEVNGWHISAPDDSWYEAYKGAYWCAKWAMKQPPREKVENAD